MGEAFIQGRRAWRGWVGCFRLGRSGWVGVIYLLMHKYEIMDVIDQGAYGIVWKAMNRDSGSLVAIKEFKEGDEDELSRKTIQREIKMLKMLKSDYVVGIKEAFKKKGKIYLIFEYFERNLLNLIEKYEHGLDPHLINVTIYKIIKCLQYLHSKNIIHRDVKPENILLNADYSVLKICDFGFARFLPEKDYDLTQYVATRWYRSPELLVGQPYGKPADLWAIGCMIGELVDGQPMFPGDDEIDQIYIINKLVSDLTPEQHNYFSNNPKFQNIELPEVKRVETIQMRYLGKIEKNALSFMKACLKVDPSQRITVEQALKHPYLINLSIQDNEFNNDEQNLLQNERKVTMKNESKASLVSIRDDEERTVSLKSKFFSNNPKQSLKLEGGSVNEREIQQQLEHKDEHNSFLKKKSHTNLPANKQLSPKNKGKQKKLSKMMSEQKNLKLNVDLNVKINLKINQNQRVTDKTNLREQLESKLNINTQSKSKLLPEIKTNSRDMMYQLNIRHQKPKQLISVIGASKQLIRGSKPHLHH